MVQELTHCKFLLNQEPFLFLFYSTTHIKFITNKHGNRKRNTHNILDSENTIKFHQKIFTDVIG